MSEEPEEFVGDAPEEPQAPQVDAREWSDDDEAEARAFGWKPATEWKGERPPSLIEDPRKFMERGAVKVLKERIDAKEREANERLAKLETVTSKAIERLRAEEKARYDAALERISGEQRRAVEEADVQSFERLEAQKQGLKPPEPFQAEPKPDGEEVQAQVHAQVRAFSKDHTWIDDPYLYERAQSIVGQGIQSGRIRGGIDAGSIAAQVKYADEQLRKYYPHLFQAAPAARASAVDGGGLATGSRRTGFDTLDAEGKADFARLVKMGVFKDTADDRKQFYDDYPK